MSPPASATPRRMRASLACAVAACLLSGSTAFMPGTALPAALLACPGRASAASAGCLALRAAKARVRPYIEGGGGAKKVKRVRNKAGKAQQSAEEAAAAASQRHLEGVQIAVRQRADQMAEALEKKGYWVCDDFLGKDAGNQMILEAAGLERGGLMSVGQSTRWNAEKGEVETYDKENVLTMQLQGGEDYFLSPRLTEYVVKLTSEVSTALNARLGAGGAPVLLETHQTNKLAVCRGDGAGGAAFYLKHYDNQGGTDRRKLTCLCRAPPTRRPGHGHGTGRGGRSAPLHARPLLSSCSSLSPVNAAAGAAQILHEREVGGGGRRLLPCLRRPRPRQSSPLPAPPPPPLPA